MASKIVIVEDNAALSDVYKTRLELLGHKVIAAYDGLQALQVIERERPDLVLLDLMVPKKAGDQILEEMRESEWGKDIKVLVMSNLNEADAPKGLRNLGIEGYAVKANLTNDQLDQLVDAILTPAGQAEDVLLSKAGNQPVESVQPHDPAAIPQAADPMSGMSQPSPAPTTAAPAAADAPAPAAPQAAAEPVVPTATGTGTVDVASIWPADTHQNPPVQPPDAPATKPEETPAPDSDSPENRAL